MDTLKIWIDAVQDDSFLSILTNKLAAPRGRKRYEKL
jgi:hypothetical protein